MKKYLKIAVIVLAVVFIAAQFFRPGTVNPPVNAADTIEADAGVPGDVKQVIARSCNDCHSNETVYPWYSQVTPFNWFLAGHIRDGREEMNFSEWNTYDAARKAHVAEEMCEQVEAGEMPLPSYLWIHRDAVLQPGDVETLCGWAKTAAGE